ncbi:MAG: transglycosylase SLT domain-containing protein [Bryobacteraceae bacterium]
MVSLKNLSRGIGLLALLVAYAGYGLGQSRSLHHSLLASSAAPSVGPHKASTAEPPEIESHIDLRQAIEAPAPGEGALGTDRGSMIAREADWHFQLGRQHYQAGEEDGARREFDQAIDLLLAAPNDPEIRAVVDGRIEELADAIHHLDLAGLGAGETDEPEFEQSPIEEIPQMTFPFDPSLKGKVLEQLRATSSQLPLDATDAVLSYIHYFSSARGRKMLSFGLGRAGRYRALIDRILDEEGVPRELIFLAQAESGFLPRAVSRQRATGMWQFMKGTGNLYGLRQSPLTDDRLDPEKATRAAARHLHDLYRHFGDWYLAMAAYNCGSVTIDRAVARTGYADFWELKRRNALPLETSNYVPIILAMTIVAKNPAEYGLTNIEPDPPLEYDAIQIKQPTNLMLIADLTDSPVSQIRDLNPALLRSTVPAAWTLRVPKGAARSAAAALEMVPPQKRCCWRAHRMVEGDSLEAVARRYRVTGNSIRMANHADGDGFRTGNLVMIPASPEPERRTVATHHAGRRYGARASAAGSGHTSAARHSGPAPKAAHGKKPAVRTAANYGAPRTSVKQ